MSRSRRKHPFCGITTARTDKYFKQLSARRVRKLNRVRVECDLEPLHPYELTNPYCGMKDGKQMFDPERWPHLMRK